MSWSSPTSPVNDSYSAGFEHTNGVRIIISVENLGSPDGDVDAAFTEAVDTLAVNSDFSLLGASRNNVGSQSYTP